MVLCWRGLGTDPAEFRRYVVPALPNGERKYYLGRRYNREKKAQGGTGANQYTVHEQRDHFDLPTAQRIAAEEHVGPATVKRAGRFAALLDEACAFGLAFLKPPGPPGRC